MNWLFALIWFGLGAAAASIAAAQRFKKVGDLEFVRGWSACLKAQDEKNPEVRNV